MPKASTHHTSRTSRSGPTPSRTTRPANSAPTGSAAPPPKRRAGASVQRDMLTVEQVADRLQISTKKVRRLITAKKIAAKQLEGQIRIPLGTYLAYVAGLPDACP